MNRIRTFLCVDASDYGASLERFKVYQALPDPVSLRLGMLRIIDESGDDYLYPAARFVPVRLPEKARRMIGAASDVAPAPHAA